METEEQIRDKLKKLQEEAKLLKKALPKKYKKQPLPKSMKDEEFFRLVKAIPNKKAYKNVKIAFLLAYESGLRISEVVNLKKEHIDIEAKRIFIKDSKFGKDRVVPLPKTWKKYMLDGIPINKGIRALQMNFKKCIRLAGLKEEYVFHSLRHSFATHALEKGMPINQVSILLGHSSVGTTNVYIRANPKDALESYEKVF